MIVCGAKTRSGTPCKLRAGWGTQHFGSGRCKLHGGNAGRPIIHGRYSLFHRQSLAEKAQRFLSDDNPSSLIEELALTRALLQEYLDRFPEGQILPYQDIERILAMVETIGRMVERISRILNATTLTQAEVMYLQKRFADLMVRYIEDSSQRTAFLADFRASLGIREFPSIGSYE